MRQSLDAKMNIFDKRVTGYNETPWNKEITGLLIDL
jgi:hypothetical protein